MKRFISPRLTKTQERKNVRQALIFVFLTILLLLGIIYFGFPLLIKFSIFWGNLKNASLPPETEDKIPPAAPELISSTEATSSAKIKISGFAEPGARVEIFLNKNLEKTLVVDADGSFILDDLEIDEGENEIYAIAKDQAGNISQPSEKIMVTLDKEPPKIEIFQPQDKTTFSRYQNKIEIKGKTEDDATVRINDHLVPTETEGKFTYSLVLSLGENKILIVATDKAGNQTETQLTLWVE